uniref:Prevent-host-death family protein n=1 Tax=Candidatus Kentrum sp. LFY TaxID=2126342 RepID=A0A450UIV0_9GAMM|nr:MAG: prevent-host-death family protein [Candidatus Kentron sp. LFY]
MVRTLLLLYMSFVQQRTGYTEMMNVSISELRGNLLKYLKSSQQGEYICVTSKGIPLATLTPPVNQSDVARAKLEKLAESAVVHDVVSPTGEGWDAMK